MLPQPIQPIAFAHADELIERALTESRPTSHGSRTPTRVPLDYRTAVTLRDVEGLSTTEAAEILGISERALKSRLHRGRMALRTQLDGYFEAGYVH